MRILTIIDKLSPGGRQRAAQDYTIGYQQAGCDVAVLSLLEAGPRLEALRRYGIPTFVGGQGAEAQTEATRRAASWGPEVIHLHSEGPVRPFEARAVAALKAALPGRVPVLETTSFGKVDYRQHYTLTDIHLLMTRWAFWRWQQWARPLRPQPLGVIVPIVVDTDTFFPASGEDAEGFRQQHGIPSDAFVFGCVARPDPLKWPSLPFRAFERVAARYPKVYYLVAGLAPNAHETVASFSPDIRRRVIEIPFLQDDTALRVCYSAMDAFLHTSPIGESFGLVFVESMACGTPVITLNTPAKNNSQVEVIGHERGGLIINDLNSMVGAMERLIQNPDLCRRLARDGAAHVHAHYTLEQVIPKLLRIATLAREATSREALREALHAESDFTTEVLTPEVQRLMRHTLGRVPLRQRALMQLVHSPPLIRAWWRLKELRTSQSR